MLYWLGSLENLETVWNVENQDAVKEPLEEEEEIIEKVFNIRNLLKFKSGISNILFIINILI